MSNGISVLTVHNRYLIRGGEDESVDSQMRMLRDRGHVADLFEENNDQIAKLGGIATAIRTVWSRKASKEIESKLKTGKYQILDCQNTFPLISPSVYYAAKKRGIPVIQTLRNFRLLCPNALFFREGRVCEDCMNKKMPWPGVLNKCYRDSYAASAAVATMLTTHNIIKTWTRTVDLFVTLTEFSRQKFIQAGIPADRIVVKPNFVDPDPGIGTGGGGFALYVGRLTKEKGIETLIKSWKLLNYSYPLKIIGDGSLSEYVQKIASKHEMIEYLGRKSVVETYEYMGKAKVLVFPSEWYETFGRVAVEAFAKGTPVIASNIGAVAELVDNGRTGLLFKPADVEDLAAKVNFMFTQLAEVEGMRIEARREYLSKYTTDINYQKLMDIYQQVLAKSTALAK